MDHCERAGDQPIRRHICSKRSIRPPALNQSLHDRTGLLMCPPHGIGAQLRRRGPREVLVTSYLLPGGRHQSLQRLPSGTLLGIGGEDCRRGPSYGPLYQRLHECGPILEVGVEGGTGQSRLVGDGGEGERLGALHEALSCIEDLLYVPLGDLVAEVDFLRFGHWLT